MRNRDFIKRPLALAEPVPFTLAILIVNSLTEGLLFITLIHVMREIARE